MKQKTQNRVVAWVLHHAALKMLSASPIQTQASQDATRTLAQLRAELSPEEMAGVDLIGRTMSQLAQKLALCDNIKMLELSEHYARELLNGNVLIADDNFENYARNE